MPRVLTLPAGPAGGVTDTAWMNGLQHCLDAPVDLFFPPHTHRAAYRQGKALCATCPLRQRCLAYALDNEDPGEPWDGLWGGMSPIERRRLHQRDGDAAPAQVA